uniref:Uncharacterized protein n=1 Tax=Panagrolaimus superbus TaxID=310955 RepID=A0A914YCS3_9BILA
MLHYIAKNPKNTKVYQKMVESCKYFFIKNPILIISKLRYIHNGWETRVNETWKSIDMNKILCKLWITFELRVVPENVNNTSVASAVVPKIYQCNFKRLLLCDQVISLKEHMILCSSVKELRLERVIVKNEDCTLVTLEKLIEQLPKIKRII